MSRFAAGLGPEHRWGAYSADQIVRPITEFKVAALQLRTSSSAIAEKPRCRVRYSFRQNSRRLELGVNILRTL